MQINRLFEIVYLLLRQQERPGPQRLKARDLARRFEVSERTIYRDLDALSAAGIPVYAQKGRGGGIALLEGFVLDRSVLSGGERESILFSLRSLQATQLPEVDTALRKLGALFSGGADDWISIDFSQWGSGPSDQDKLSTFKAAILHSQRVRFDYFSAAGERTCRQVEPLRLHFKVHTWYLQAWDRTREDFRLFRLSRIHAPQLDEETFDRAVLLSRERQRKSEEPAGSPPELVTLRLRFSPAVVHRLLDDFDASRLSKGPEGELLLEVTYPEDEWVYGYLLSFGDAMEVLSPPHIREILRQRAGRVAALYEDRTSPSK